MTSMSAHEHSEDCDCEHEAISALLFGGVARGPEEHLSTLDRTIEQFGTTTRVADRRLVARCLFSKAQTLARQGRHGDAIAPCAQRERRATDDADIAVQTWLGEGMAGMAAAFSQLWLPDRARDVLRRAAKHFANAADAKLRAFAPRALCDECVIAR